ncbi:MAG: AAA family ATPase, partial [bacterium]
MYLQRIELQGFKSFAQKTVLEFPSPEKGKEKASCGITTIVGPNGSGKSNVVDAVRWVLGEQSLKLLRGKKATDIIFAGSAGKARLGMAEVSLYLNNEDGSSEIDYSEIVITRKLYQDGASDYLLNKNQVRLFDILMLLAKASFGQNTYSIIGQGMVDKIVNYSSAERKEFFDEATGIKQYQIKRDKSVNKLKRSRENIEQANVLLVELEPRLKSLTRQVNKLRQRQEIEKELHELQLKYYGKIWSDLGVNYEQHALSYNLHEKQRQTINLKLEQLQERLNKFGQENDRSQEFNKLQENSDSLSVEKNNILKDLTVVKGKMEVEYTKAGKQNLTWLENRKDEIEEKIRQTEVEIKKIQSKVSNFERDLKEKEPAVHKLNDELTVLQNNLQIIQDEYYNQKNGGKINYSYGSVKAVLKLKTEIAGIYGTVSDVGKINKSYESALSSVAGNRLSAIVVATDEIAVKCINYLKDNRLGSVTFFPLNKLSSYPISHEAQAMSRENGVIDLAINLVQYDNKFQKVFEQIFGSTLVVKTIDDAKDIGIGRERMVTLDGDLLEKSGVMKGGYRKKEFLRWSQIEDKDLYSQEEKMRQISELKVKIENQYKAKETFQSQLSEIKINLQVENNQITGLSQELLAFKKEKIKIQEEINEGQLTPAQQDEYFKNLKVKKEELEKQIQDLDKKISAVREKMDQFNSKEEEKRREIFAIQQEIYESQNQLNTVVATLNEVKIELAKIETKKEDTFIAMKEDLGEDYSPKNSVDISEVDLEEFKVKIDKCKKQLELIGGIDPEIEKEYEDVSQRFEFLKQQSTDLDIAIHGLEKIVLELDKLIKKQFEEEFKKINSDFTRYFKKLFEGGTAKLTLTQKQDEQTEAEIIREEISGLPIGEQQPETEAEAEKNVEEKEKKIIHPEDRSFLANMGIDIEVCPPGKKIKNISVLSGGEKTMTALALICAIISNNPSPFVLFDEVDAALDESNSTKFSDIIEELSHHTQFVVITHNRAIMARADVL